MKVNKSGGHAMPRYVILFSDMLMYCKFKGALLHGGVIELPKTDALEVCCVLPLKHMTVTEVVGKGVFTIKCQNENLILYSPNAEDSNWVDMIQKTIRTLKKNKASLRRESSMFQPMRKPDLIKMRRESLGKIMLMRKSDEAKMELLKSETKTRSPLSLLTPKKRSAKDSPSGSPFKLKRLVEEEMSPKTKSPDCSEEAKEEIEEERETLPLPELMSPVRTSPRLKLSPVRKSPRLKNNSNKDFASPELILRKKQRNDLLRHTKSLTLGRLGSRARKEKTGGSIFRSPSIYDDTSRSVLQERNKDEGNIMSSYLSGKICPLTPSTKPCNVDHLVKKSPDITNTSPSSSKHSEEDAVSKDVSDQTNPADSDENKMDETDTIKVNPIEIHDGILNERKSVCTIS